MNKNLIPIPEEWRKHRLLCFVYWAFHYFFVNLIALKHYHRIYLFHDIEKPFKILFGVPYTKVSMDHIMKAKHHPAFKDPSKVNWIEAVCDWEASGYTKPNSLLNARETCKKYYSHFWEYVEPVLKKGKL